MPARYEAIRDKMIRQGFDVKSAKERAAKIYNGTLRSGEKAVGGHSESSEKSEKSKKKKGK